MVEFLGMDKMKHHGWQNLKGAFRQGAAIIVVAAIVALAINYLRPESLELVSDWSAASRLEAMTGSENMSISAQKAIAFHGSGKAVFIDARRPDSFLKGHIAGALNIPAEAVFEHLDAFSRAFPEKDTVVIAYCQKEPCPLGREVVRLLQDMGYANARILENGWTRWKARGYPLKRGEATNRSSWI